MGFYAKWSERENLSTAEVEFLAKRLLENNERYALTAMLKRFDMDVSVFTDVLESGNTWLIELITEAVATSGVTFRTGWLKWYASSDDSVQSRVATQVVLRYDDMTPSLLEGLWDLGSTTARVAVLESELRRSDEPPTEHVEWLVQVWRDRASQAKPVSLGSQERHTVKHLVTKVLSLSEACDLPLEKGLDHMAPHLWSRVLKEGGAGGFTSAQADFLAEAALTRIRGRHARALVGTAEFEAAITLAGRLEEEHELVTTLKRSAAQVRGWDGSVLPTEGLIRKRAEEGLVDEATFFLLAKAGADDPLRWALAHKAATAQRVAAMARVEDLTGVLAEKSHTWRTELMKQVWKHALRHGFETARTALFRALAKEHTRDELAEVFKIGTALVPVHNAALLVTELGSDLASPVLDQMTLRQILDAEDALAEAMLEELHSELGASPAALETFHALSDGFEGSFKELVSTCADLL